MLIIFFAKIGIFWNNARKLFGLSLEERWQEYKKPTRQPIQELPIDLGKTGKNIIFASVTLTLMGSSIVYIILIAEFMSSLVPSLSICAFTTIAAIIFVPFTWLGTPKDFWLAPVIAVLATTITCIVLFIQLIADIDTSYLPKEPLHRNPTFTTFLNGLRNDYGRIWGSIDISDYSKRYERENSFLEECYFSVYSTSYVVLTCNSGWLLAYWNKRSRKHRFVQRNRVLIGR
ncbi:hypothetical protein Avbf_14737 [Armadillidium vulgare]|nr:hypothetical protein Avbf_14737 [Armadillidium vulgare]